MPMTFRAVDLPRRAAPMWRRQGLVLCLLASSLPACAVDRPSTTGTATAQESRMSDASHSSPDALVRAAKATDPSVLQRLLEAGADPDARNADDEPLLRVAQLAGRWDNVRLLLERGADINAHPPNRPDDTVLAFYSGGQFDKAAWLLEHGADPGYRIETAAASDRVGAQPIVENIYWWPVQAAKFPALAQWQRKSQDLLAAKGFTAPLEPPHLRKLRDAQAGGRGAEPVELAPAIDDAERQVRDAVRK